MNVCPGVASTRSRILADRHPCRHRDRGAGKPDRVGPVDQVPRAGRPGQRQPAGDIVVVDVRLGHVGDAHAPLGGQAADPVDVPLGVDNKCQFMPMPMRIAAVAGCGSVMSGSTSIMVVVLSHRACTP